MLANLPWALLPTAHAASYEIVFDEGAFQYDSASSAENQDNKYLARVTVNKVKNVKNAKACIGCGFCSRDCPVDAIAMRGPVKMQTVAASRGPA